MTKRAKIVVLAVAVLAALAFTGCSSKSSGSEGGNQTAGAAPSGGVGGMPNASEQEQLRKFEQCLREQGVEPPEPGEPGARPSVGHEPTAKEQAAMEKCSQFLPNGGEPEKLTAQQIEQLRKYAKCMRDNGIDYFPDPSAGGKKDEMSEADGQRFRNDPKRPAAEEKCRPLLAGLPGQPGSK
jgi:hypothetical protein